MGPNQRWRLCCDVNRGGHGRRYYRNGYQARGRIPRGKTATIKSSEAPKLRREAAASTPHHSYRQSKHQDWPIWYLVEKCEQATFDRRASCRGRCKEYWIRRPSSPEGHARRYPTRAYRRPEFGPFPLRRQETGQRQSHRHRQRVRGRRQDLRMGFRRRAVRPCDRAVQGHQEVGRQGDCHRTRQGCGRAGDQERRRDVWCICVSGVWHCEEPKIGHAYTVEEGGRSSTAD